MSVLLSNHNQPRYPSPPPFPCLAQDIARQLAHAYLLVFGRAYLLEILLAEGPLGRIGFVGEHPFIRIRISLRAYILAGASVVARVVLMWS
jgi:hypothetical protein